jgi:hypothetical protein
MYQTYIQYFTLSFVLNSLTILLILVLKLMAMGQGAKNSVCYAMQKEPGKNQFV